LFSGKCGSLHSIACIISGSGSPTLTPPIAYPSKSIAASACALERRNSAKVAP
jgi:hypothetical protein